MKKIIIVFCSFLGAAWLVSKFPWGDNVVFQLASFQFTWVAIIATCVGLLATQAKVK